MGNNHDYKLLFDEEMKVLYSCKDEIKSGKYEGNTLLHKYQKLVRHYERLLKFTKKIVRIADTQGNVLKKREYKIQSLLDNSNQGFLTFDGNLLVDEEYSAECERIFGKKIKKEHIPSLLSDNKAEQRDFINAFKSVFREYDETILHQLPASLNINNKIIDIQYKLINRLDNEYAILIILTDITDRAKTEAKIKFLSEHDSLTSLYNRSYVDKIISKVTSPFNLPLSIILADMNALKLTNDVFGHQKGDELIIKMAEILKKCCRETDTVARWGGDEFLILLPNTRASQCQRIVETINSLCRDSEEDLLNLSVSMGTATMNNPTTNINDLFAAAENKMYKNKLLDRKAVRKNIINKIEIVLEKKAIIPPEHIKRIKEMVIGFTGVLGFAQESAEVQKLLLLASLHDVGKIIIPEALLKKEGKLDPNEWEIVKSYPEVGYRMAQSIGEPDVAEGILALCERWDGTGYPAGLKGDQIPYISRVLTILEAYDMMTNNQSIKNAVNRKEALAIIKNQRGYQFDPTLTKIFLDNFSSILPKEG